MALQHINISVDNELVKAAKEAGINLSAFMRESLAFELKRKNVVEIDEVINDLASKIKTGEEILVAIENFKIKAVESEKAWAESVRSKYSTIPEVSNITEEQILDTKFMIDLVRFLHEKYNVTASIAEIKAYRSMV